MKEEKRELFLCTYKMNLEQTRLEFPEQYVWPLEKLDHVFDLMVAAFDRGHYNKDGIAFRRTCEQLGIGHTYKAINEFVER